VSLAETQVAEVWLEGTRPEEPAAEMWMSLKEEPALEAV